MEALEGPSEWTELCVQCTAGVNRHQLCVLSCSAFDSSSTCFVFFTSAVSLATLLEEATGSEYVCRPDRSSICKARDLSSDTWSFYKAKTNPPPRLSFPYLFITTLNHPLTLNEGPSSIPSLFLLYSISLIPLRLPTSLFGWVTARWSWSTERRESSLIWWKHFRVWPSSPSGPFTSLGLADLKHSGNPRWSSVVLALTWNLLWMLLHTYNMLSAAWLMRCWSCALTSAKGNNAGWNTHKLSQEMARK